MQFFEDLRAHPRLAEFRSRAAAYKRQFHLDRAIRAALATRSGPIPDAVVAEICETWGDPTLIAADGYLQALLLEAQKARGHILQCGADLTTLLLAIMVERRGVRLWTLENNPRSANLLRAWISQYHLSQANIIAVAADLTKLGVGYTFDTERLRGPLSLVVCEASNVQPGSARRLLPSIMDKLDPDAVMLVRNVRRRGDAEYLSEWSRGNGASMVVKGKTDPFAKIVMRSRVAQDDHREARMNTAFAKR